MPLEYLDDILMIMSAYLCLRESGWKSRKGILDSDSTGVETDRYGYEERPVRSKKTFELIRIKWHITDAALDYQIILSARTTGKKTCASPVLWIMLSRLKKLELILPARYLMPIRHTILMITANPGLKWTSFQTSRRRKTPRTKVGV